MINPRMEEKIANGECLDLSDNPKVGDDFVLTNTFVDGVDYCVLTQNDWIRSIGKRHRDGVILASTSGKYYQHPDFECIWLR